MLDERVHYRGRYGTVTDTRTGQANGETFVMVQVRFEGSDHALWLDSESVDLV